DRQTSSRLNARVALQRRCDALHPAQSPWSACRALVPEADGDRGGDGMTSMRGPSPEAPAAHTPGPWRLYRRNVNHAYVIESNLVLVARMIGVNDTVTANYDPHFDSGPCEHKELHGGYCEE